MSEPISTKVYNRKAGELVYTYVGSFGATKALWEVDTSELDRWCAMMGTYPDTLFVQADFATPHTQS